MDSPPSTTGKRSRTSSLASDISDSSTKRTRVDEEVEEMLQVSLSGQQPDAVLQGFGSPASEPRNQPTIRDETYYLQDGSCILRVQNTLFNVHRTLLAKDGSLFSSMFSLPQGEHEIEGISDECPIHLSGETVSEFKNFLWVLYALPHELAEITGPQIDLARLNRLIDIARVSFKYHFRSLETWALDVINEQVNRKPVPSIFCLPSSASALLHSSNTSSGSAIASSPFASQAPQAASPQAIVSNGALISRLMRLAQLCAHEKLLDTMIAVLKVLMGHSIQYAHLAMTLADELDLRPLRGIAYFEVMQSDNSIVPRTSLDVRSRGASAPERRNVPDAEGRLIVTPEQKLRLLTGYHRLTLIWEELRATPPSFEHAPACSATWHQHGCTQCWLDFWKEKTRSDAVMQHGLADVLGRLKAISKEFVRWGSAAYMHQDCRMIVRRVIQEKIRTIEEELPDYFVEDTSG
ncbi:uncharacterized protein PHACADRAFT_261745 [Phanerochaete carnosa HHB-10118-sp]|uniref:BTB domain-containing protein n=1 Tax=Phanerochaete carnosa (strain HHB-10118-sp) TaxID=650164 RepID=K5UP49_PHACS|nr:uncharacterized protein PHACADRAFT_261745 [Phanerochaete carnosa HHB-10118-sp]EKM51541.1 hypothetical protein PHACADRAFT_261745 [Phanerochaete carnosa HHB-10118-sp]